MAVDFYVEAAANPDLSQGWTFAATPYGDKATAGTEPQYRLGPIVIAELNQTVWELHQDIGTLSGLMHELPMELPRRHEILRALERMLDVMDPDDVPGTAAAGRAALADVLARPAYASAHQLVATGHAHIDSAWLWPVRETIRKCARTFSNVVALMDEDPGSCSPAPRRSSWPGSRSTTRSCSRGSGKRSRPASSSRSAACGSNRTATCPAARPWRASSWKARASSWPSSASSARRPGCRTPSATPPRCRRSSRPPAAAGS